MKKMNYVAPTMTVMVVELEKGFMSASITNEDMKGVKVESANQNYQGFDCEGGDLSVIEWEE